jgi:four helix bundle protein
MSKQYDLEERTEHFARDIRLFVRNIELDIANREDIKQIVRSSGSVAANYIEANESLSKKDFLYRAKICRKEVKETRLWLRLIKENREEENIKEKLIMESTELLKIFSTIIAKSKL